MKFLCLIFTLIIVFNLNAKDNNCEIVLTEGQWYFTELDSSNWLPASTPGCIHTDLLANQIIENPFYNNNEQKQKWIELKNWSYKTEFEISKSMFEKSNLNMVFEGLDTYATVLLNDSVILSSDNMFRLWEVDVKKLLKIGFNTLIINFFSPLNVNESKFKSSAYILPSGCESGELRVGAYTRKAAYHFGWDWGPRFVTSGIWKPIKLVAWEEVKINSIKYYTLNILDKKARNRVDITIDAKINKTKNYRLSIDENETVITLKPGVNKVAFSFNVRSPKLWWSNGLGKPNLYKLKVKLRSIRGHKLFDKRSINYGIRKIELIQKNDKIGTSFYFKLNGKPVFMKGANYIPQDMFLNRVTEEKYIKLINSVKESNINMLRVWGGGVYEKDLFYELCDKNGILIWQDFMFAGSMYPNDSNFIETIKYEIRDNVNRLQHHPCIALWCGNNEIDVAWKNWGWQKQYNYTKQDSIELWHNYKNIFHYIIPQLLNKYDGSRAYTPSSPISNWGNKENFNHGSMHYWGVWHGKESFESFKNNVGRFMVEYGFQSFPSIESLKKVIPDSCLSLSSITMKNRQKSYIGNSLILKHINQYFKQPENFVDFIEKSQITQAIGIGIAIDAHLNSQPHCMGSLFWQLNDCWPGPSWSVIDYYGERKIAYDTIKIKFK